MLNANFREWIDIQTLFMYMPSIGMYWLAISCMDLANHVEIPSPTFDKTPAADIRTGHGPRFRKSRDFGGNLEQRCCTIECQKSACYPA